MRKRNWQRKLITVNICFICFRFPVFWFPSFLFFVLIAFCFLHKMVASCSFRFKLKWRPRQLAAAIRELCAAQLTQSHPSTVAFPLPFPLFLPDSPDLPVILTCATFYYNQRKLIFAFFSALRFVKNQLSLFSFFVFLVLCAVISSSHSCLSRQIPFFSQRYSRF